LTVTDPEVARLIDTFEAKDDDLEAIEALGRMGKKSADPLRAALKDKNSQVRFRAVWSLAFMEPDLVMEAAAELMPLLKDDDPGVRYKTVFVLQKIGDRSGDAYLGIIGALNDKDDSVRDTAIEVVEKLGAPPKEAVPGLAQLAGKNNEYTVRSKAMVLLGKAGAPAAPVFKSLLKSADSLDTIELIRAISHLGSVAKPILPDLQTIMIKKRDFWDAENELIETFKKCGPDGGAGLAAVLRALHDDPKSPDFAPGDARTAVLLKAIGEIGADAKAATPVLVLLLENGDRWNVEVLDALGGIGPAAKDAMPAVRKLVGTRFDAQAQAALKRMGAKN
jgi:HEAT repeat protein